MKGIEIVRARVEKLSRKEWMDIIEERRKIITAKLDDFTLPRLGNLEMLVPQHFLLSINKLHPRTGVAFTPNSLDANLQGWFGYALPEGPRFRDVTGQTCRLYSWGLNRSGKWLVIHWHLVFATSDWSKDSLVTMTVTVRELDLETMLELSEAKPEHVCMRLSKIIYAWERKLLERLASIQEIAAGIERDDSVVRGLGDIDAAVHWPSRGPEPPEA